MMSHTTWTTLQFVKDKDLDYIFYDIGITNYHNTNWYLRVPDATTRAVQNDGTLIEWSQAYAHVYMQRDQYYLTEPFCVEFDLIENSYGGIQFYSGSANTGRLDYTFSDTGHYKITNTLSRQEFYLDGKLIKSSSINFTQSYVVFVSVTSQGTPRKIKYRNFIAYEI